MPAVPPGENAPFCARPFTTALLNSDGALRCCPSSWMEQPLGHLRDGDLESQWNSRQAAALRQSILDASFRFCNHENCPFLRLGGEGLPARASVDAPLMKKALGEALVEVPWGPDSVEYEAGDGRNALDGATVLGELFSFGLSDARTLKLSGPFNGPKLLEAIQAFPWDRYISLRLELKTRGLSLSPACWRAMAPCHNAIQQIEVVLDTVNRRRFDANEPGISFAEHQQNLKHLAQLRAKGAFATLAFTFMVTSHSLDEMKAFVRRARRFRADIIGFHAESGGDADAVDPIHLPNSSEHASLCAILKDPLFTGSDIQLGNLAMLQSFETSAIDHAPAEGGSHWYPCEMIVETLSLDAEASAQLRLCINTLKDETVALFQRPAQNDEPSPLALLAHLRREIREPAAIQTTFENYLATQRMEGQAITYATARLQLEKRSQGALVKCLSTEQRVAFSALRLRSLLEVDTGYDPLEKAIRQLEGAATGAAETHPVFEDWVKGLALDPDAEATVRATINQLKDDFASIFARTPKNGGHSPTDFLAQLSVDHAKDIEARFLEYARSQLDPVSGLSYFEAFNNRKLRSYQKIVGMTPQARTYLQPGDGAILLDVDTGYQPFRAAVRDAEHRLRRKAQDDKRGAAP